MNSGTAAAVEGLSDGALRGPALPSGWSCLGMVQYLTLSVDRLDPALPAAGVLDRYRHEASLADAVIAASSPDADLAWWPFPEGEWRLQDLREVLLHVITETACHAGHLDAARELVDGQQWLVNTSLVARSSLLRLPHARTLDAPIRSPCHRRS